MMDFGASIPEQVDYMVYIWFLIGLSVKILPTLQKIMVSQFQFCNLPKCWTVFRGVSLPNQSTKGCFLCVILSLLTKILFSFDYSSKNYLEHLGMEQFKIK